MISEAYSKKGFHYLYNINSIYNLESIFNVGLLSKNLVKKLGIDYVDLSNPEVQSLRDYKFIGNRINLHDFANLYFNPRNAMMYYLIHNDNSKATLNDLCVLVINNEVLDYETSFVSNGNAAKFGTQFYNCADGIEALNPEEIFIKNWDDPNIAVKENKKRKMFAEVLIKDGINRKQIEFIAVENEIAKEKIEKLNLDVDVVINKKIFFAEESYD